MTITHDSPEALRRTARAANWNHARQRDLELAGVPGALTRTEALNLAVRMVSRHGLTGDERRALRELMRRHGLSAPQITVQWRKATGRAGLQAPGLGRR